MIFEYEFVPRFSDFDRLSMVHHSVYLKYIEEARIDAFEEMFKNKMEDFLDEICDIVVTEINIKYLNVIDERKKHKIILDIDFKSGVYIIFYFKIINNCNKLYSKGSLKVCFVDKKGKLMLAYPKYIKKYIDINDEIKVGI